MEERPRDKESPRRARRGPERQTGNKAKSMIRLRRAPGGSKRPTVEKAKLAAVKITLSRNQVRRELDLAASVVPGKTAVPVLNNLLLMVKGGKLWMRATNLDTEFYAACDMKGGTEFSVGINARKFEEIVRLLPENQFDLYVDPSMVRIECGNAYFRLPVVAREQFPRAHPKPDKSMTLPATFTSMIDSVLFSAGKEESRYAIQGVKLEVRKEGRLRLVSTNGVRLSLAETDCKSGFELDVILSRQSLSVLARLLEDQGCEMHYGGRFVRFRAGDRVISSRVIEGEFPNYELILPAHTTSVTVNSLDFAMALNRASLCADDRSHAIGVIFRNQEIELRSATQEDGEAEEIVPVGLNLEQPIGTGFNVDYLREFLAVAPEGDVQIYFKDGISVFELRPSGCSWIFRHVIAPLKI